MRGHLEIALEQMKAGANELNLSEMQLQFLQSFFFNLLGKPKKGIASFKALEGATFARPAL